MNITQPTTTLQTTQAMCGKLTSETLSLLHGYQLELTMLAQVYGKNSGQQIGLPPADFALRHALLAATAVTQADRKRAQGEWALRTLLAERQAA